MNIFKYSGKTVERDILFWISGLCLTKSIQSIQQRRGKDSAYKTPPFLQAESCVLWHLKRKCLLFSLGLSRSSLFTVSSCHHRHRWSFFFCVLIPDTVTGTLITARLQTLTRKRIDCAGVVTNIALCSQTHYKVFNRGTRRGFLCVPIKNVSESYSQHLWQPWEMKFPWTEWWILERPKNSQSDGK